MLETRLSHCEFAAAKKLHSAFESAFAYLHANGAPKSSGSASDAVPEGGTGRSAEQHPENPNTDDQSSVVLPEGPGEAAGSPAETDDMPGPAPDNGASRDDARREKSPSL